MGQHQRRREINAGRCSSGPHTHTQKKKKGARASKLRADLPVGGWNRLAVASHLEGPERPENDNHDSDEAHEAADDGAWEERQTSGEAFCKSRSHFSSKREPI